jgi:wobble nucleotide-excising tRNase
MLNRLQYFRSVGLFEAVSPPNALALAPMTLIYAENGRGKTTLSAILRSLATGVALPIIERQRLGSPSAPHIVIDCDGGPPHAIFQNGAWNRPAANIAIFDDAFVDGNICSGLVVDSEHRQNLHELILGAQGVALNRTLQQAVEGVETHNRALRAKGEAIPAAERGGLSVDAFWALPARDAIDDAIQEAERNLAAAEQQAAIRAAQGFEPFSLPEINSDKIAELLRTQLADLDADAAQQVQTHLASIGENSEAWVASGVDRVNGERLSDCPFCAQDLGGSTLVNHYRVYFSTAYASLKKAVAQAIQEFMRLHGGGSPAAFERAIRIAVERRQFWSRFAEIPEIAIDTAEINRAWSVAHTTLLTVLRAKQDRPLDPSPLNPEAVAAVAAYERHRLAVEALSNLLQKANAAIAIVREQAAAGNIAALRGDVARLKAVKARHSPEIARLCDDYLVEKTAKAAAEQRRDAARTALDSYRSAIFPTYQVSINEYLRKFNAGFRLDQITPQNTRGGSACTYNVLINNQPVAVGASPTLGAPSFRNSLSAGDRNALALAFFFASLDQDPALADKVVVIDDPVSSLDEHRSLTTVQEVRRLMQRAGQVIVLSHNKPFLCNIWEGTDDTLRASLEVARDGLGSTIRGWDVKRDMITEHDRRHVLLREYQTGASADGREVAQALRPIIEAFLRVAYPAYFPPGAMLGPFRGLCEQRLRIARSNSRLRRHQRASRSHGIRQFVSP